jgi:hypothetical protein
MAYGDDSERIRKRAWEGYINPQIRKGAERVSVQIRPLMKDMESKGFPTNHPRQFCKALQKKSFLQEKGLVLERLDGPPSGTSTTVVLHFRVQNEVTRRSTSQKASETPKEKAFRLTERIRGLMKDQVAAHGGAMGYLRWVRSEDAE